MAFPIKTLRLYRVRKTFTSERSNHKFDEGRRLTYLSSTTNHHEGIEICEFRDFDNSAILTLHADDFFLDKFGEHFEEIPFPG